MIFELQRVDLLREVRAVGLGFRLACAADEGRDGLARDHEERVGQTDAAPLLHVEDAREIRLERERQVPVARRTARAPAEIALSLTVRMPTSVMPEGTAIKTRGFMIL